MSARSTAPQCNMASQHEQRRMADAQPATIHDAITVNASVYQAIAEKPNTAYRA